MDASVEIHPSMKQDTAVIGKTVWPQGESCCTSRLIRPTELWCVAGKYNSIISSRLRKLRGAPGHGLPLPGEWAPRSRAGKLCCCFLSMAFRPGGGLGWIWWSFYLSWDIFFFYPFPLLWFSSIILNYKHLRLLKVLPLYKLNQKFENIRESFQLHAVRRYLSHFFTIFLS